MPHGFDSMFAWTIFIFLLTGFTFFCWMGSFYIFGHPEKVANYHLLKKLHKLEEPQRFEITAAPRGEFLKPSQLLERYGVLPPLEITRLNETWIRNFLRNYHQMRGLVAYATGTYKILMVAPLTQKNIFYPGMVTLLQSLEEPKVLLEQVFTSNNENLPALEASLVPGQEIKLEKPQDLSVIIFLEHLANGRLKFTTMPLLYGTYGTQGMGQNTFSLEPPENLHIEGGLPILTKKQIESFNQAPATTSPLSMDLNAQKAPEENPLNKQISGQEIKRTLVRINKEETKPLPLKAPLVPQVVQEPTPSTALKTTQQIAPGANIPRAIPLNAPRILPAIPVTSPPSTSQNSIDSTTKSNAPVSLEKTTSPGSETTSSFIPSVASNATLLPSPQVVDPMQLSSPIENAPPQGGIENTSTTSNPSLSTWSLYEPGKMPRGRLLGPKEFATLGDQGALGKQLYISGDFSVTASGDHNAVLRYQAGAMNLPVSLCASIRIIVEYPSGMLPPATGTSLSQDRLHPLMITDVKRETNGTLNIYVRSITK